MFFVWNKAVPWTQIAKICCRKITDISRALVINKSVDLSDVFGAAPLVELITDLGPSN